MPIDGHTTGDGANAPAPPTIKVAGSAASSESPGADATVAQSPNQATDAAKRSRRNIVLAGYEVEGEVGRGGMGVVFKARDTRLNRPVALKMVLARGNESDVLRFRLEAEAMAAVRHPNVAQVFEAGDGGDGPFLAMEYLPGGTLSAAFKARGALPPTEAAALVAKVAAGVAAAHRAGIVHRDLKPGNVLLDAAGEPKVTDFGLAKLGAETDLTATGAVIGTPAYMAPEQAGGGAKFVGPTADVWSLGVILYEAVTGKRPFEGPTPQAVLSGVTTVTPRAPRTLVRAIPRDLELICLKCLEKEPHERYATATELAADLDRFARGDAISVRPAGPVERTLKWARRKPTEATAYALAGAAVVLLVFGGTVAWLWRDAVAAHGRAEGALDGEKDARSRADTARDEATGARDQLKGALDGEKAARDTAEGALAGQKEARATAEGALAGQKEAREMAERALAGEKAALRRLELQQYARAVDLAHREWQAGNIARAESLLAACKPAHRGWEWDYVHRLCHSDVHTLPPDPARGGTSASSVEFDPTGERLLAADFSFYGVWDVRTGKLLAGRPTDGDGVRYAHFSPDGKRVAIVGGRSVVVWDPVANKIISTSRPEKNVRNAHLGAGGTRLLILTNGDPVLHDPDTGKAVATLTGHKAGGAAPIACFTPNGQQVVTAGDDGTVRVWDAKTGEQTPVLVEGAGNLIELAVSPDGKRVAAVRHGDFSVQVWDLATGKLQGRFTGHRKQVMHIEFASSSDLVGSVDTAGKAFVWAAGDGRVVEEHVGFAPGHGTLFNTRRWQFLTGDLNGGVRVAEVVRSWPGPASTVLRADEGELRTLAHSPDGRFLATGGADGTIRIWDQDRSHAVVTHFRAGGTIASVDFSADGRLIATAGSRGVRVFRAGDPEPPDPDPNAPYAFMSLIRFNAAGTAFLTAHGKPEHCVKLWKVGEAKPTHVLPAIGAQIPFRVVTVAEFSPDGARVVIAWTHQAEVDVFNVATGKKEFSVPHPEGGVTFAGYTRDGKKLVTGSQHGVCAWDATGRLLHKFAGAKPGAKERFQFGLGGIAIHPDGKRAVAAVHPNQLATFDLVTGAERVDPFGFLEFKAELSFNPDGTRLLAGGLVVRLYDFEAREELITLETSDRKERPLTVRFSPDGTRVLAEHAFTVVVWDSRPVNPAFVRRPVAPQPKPKP